MDRYFIDLMLDQVREGHKTGYTFSNEAWIDMALSFVDRFGLQYDKDLLKIQHNRLGKVYNDLKNLLAQRGFSWDERKQMVTAYGGVWAAYIKVNWLLFEPYKSYLFQRDNISCNYRNTQMQNHTKTNPRQIIMTYA